MRDGGSHFAANEANFADKQHLLVSVDGLERVQTVIDVVDANLWVVPAKGIVRRVALGGNQFAEHLSFAVDIYRRAADDLHVMIAAQ